MYTMYDANVLKLRRYSVCTHREIRNTLILFCFGVTFCPFFLFIVRQLLVPFQILLFLWSFYTTTAHIVCCRFFDFKNLRPVISLFETKCTLAYLTLCPCTLKLSLLKALSCSLVKVLLSFGFDGTDQ